MECCHAKKIAFVFSMGLAITTVTGCGGDDDHYSTGFVCKSRSDSFNLNGLEESQRTNLNEQFMDSCKSFFYEMPACKTDMLDYMGCVLDSPKSYWEEQKELEYKCNTDYHSNVG